MFITEHHLCLVWKLLSPGQEVQVGQERWLLSVSTCKKELRIGPEGDAHNGTVLAGKKNII